MMLCIMKFKIGQILIEQRVPNTKMRNTFYLVKIKDKKIH